MKKYKFTLYHAILVGAIASISFIISGWLTVTTWVVFFAWANYFLHESHIIKASKMVLALVLGVVIAFISSNIMAYANDFLLSYNYQHLSLYANGVVIFFAATFLVFLECIEGWGKFVPATFLGTVLFFAIGLETPLKTMLADLIIPLVLGVAAGYITIVSRQYLDNYLKQKS